MKNNNYYYSEIVEKMTSDNREETRKDNREETSQIRKVKQRH